MKHRDAKYSFLNGSNGEFTNSDDVENIYTVCATLLNEYDYTLYLRCKLDKEIYRKECYCGCYSYAFCIPVTSIQDSKSLRTLEFLNGINGEATNSDDVKDAVDLANAKRIAKEAANKQFSHNGEKKSKPGNGAAVCKHFLNGNCTRVPCRFYHPPQDECQVVEIQPIKQRIPKVYYELQGHEFTVEGTKFLTYIPVEGDVKIELDSQSRDIEIPAFKFFGKTYNKGNFRINMFLYDYLLSKLKVLPNQERNLVAFEEIKLTLRDFKKDLVEGTSRFYLFKNQERLPSSDVTIESDIPYSMGISVNIVNIRTIPCTLSIVPGEYMFNEMFKIVRGKGFSFEMDKLIVQQIRFCTELPIKESDRNYRAFCDFTPRQPFQVYAPCAINVCSALSRYFKSAYPEYQSDWVRRNNQYKLLTGISIRSIEEVCDLCGADVVYDEMPPAAVYPFFLNILNPIQLPSFNNEYSPVAEDSLHASSVPPLDAVQEVDPASVVEDSCKVQTMNFCEYQVRSRHGFNYTVPPGDVKSTFVRSLEAYYDKVYYKLLFIKFVMYICDFFGGMWNAIIYVVYTPILYFLDYASLIGLVVLLPHVKRLLYQNMITRSSLLFKIIHNVGSFESKFKWEFGKVNKVGRLYATGSHLALADYMLAQFLAYLFKQEILVGIIRIDADNILEVKCQYSDTQERYSADRMFGEASSLPNNTIKLYFFSDDGFIVSNINGIFKILETDFSMMDSTNGLPVFAALYHLSKISGFEIGAARLIEQCARSTIVYNPDSSSRDREYVELQPETFMEYSGSKLTSVLNDIAEVGFISSIYEEMAAMEAPVLSSSLIMGAAEKYGWKVTVSEKHSFNSSTFLKRAYNGTVSWLVYGAVLRSLGKVDGIPRPEQFGVQPKEFKNMSNAALFERLLLQTALGLVNEPTSPLVCALRYRVGIIKEFPSSFEVEYVDLNDRYGTETYEWLGLVDAIINVQLGAVCTLPVLEKVFGIDYGTEVQIDRDFEFGVISVGGHEVNALV
jgi:hypothetical protein